MEEGGGQGSCHPPWPARLAHPHLSPSGVESQGFSCHTRMWWGLWPWLGCSEHKSVPRGSQAFGRKSADP